MSKKVKKPRKKTYKKDVSDAEKQLSATLNKFDRLENNCLICNKVFDKGDKEMVLSWNVVVMSDSVKLYCPSCWNRASGLINQIKEIHGKR